MANHTDVIGVAEFRPKDNQNIEDFKDLIRLVYNITNSWYYGNIFKTMTIEELESQLEYVTDYYGINFVAVGRWSGHSTFLRFFENLDRTILENYNRIEGQSIRESIEGLIMEFDLKDYEETEDTCSESEIITQAKLTDNTLHTSIVKSVKVTKPYIL